MAAMLDPGRRTCSSRQRIAASVKNTNYAGVRRKNNVPTSSIRPSFGEEKASSAGLNSSSVTGDEWIMFARWVKRNEGSSSLGRRRSGPPESEFQNGGIDGETGMKYGILPRRVTPLLRVMAVRPCLIPPSVGAQDPQAPPPPPTPKAAAPIDLTGYWVSVVTEDWRFRMITPDKGDYQSVPMNAEGLKVANAWDPGKDEAAGEQCKYYGAGAVMRNPGMLHISWQDDNTLRVETDA